MLAGINRGICLIILLKNWMDRHIMDLRRWLWRAKPLVLHCIVFRTGDKYRVACESM